MAKVEHTAREKLLRLGEALQADQDGLRQLFLSLFPDGLKFEPRKCTMPRTWTISGVANLGGSNLRGDPTGKFVNLDFKIPFDFMAAMCKRSRDHASFS